MCCIAPGLTLPFGTGGLETPLSIKPRFSAIPFAVCGHGLSSSNTISVRYPYAHDALRLACNIVIFMHKNSDAADTHQEPTNCYKPIIWRSSSVLLIRSLGTTCRAEAMNGGMMLGFLKFKFKFNTQDRLVTSVLISRSDSRTPSLP
jgi:hypothetical protein